MSVSAPQPPASPAHPVRLLLSDDLQRNRLTVFFRLLLSIPHFIWLTLWGIASLVVAIVNWLCTLILARSPGGLHRFLAAYVKYATQFHAYLHLAADPYPSFDGTPGYPVDVEIPAARGAEPRDGAVPRRSCAAGPADRRRAEREPELERGGGAPLLLLHRRAAAGRGVHGLVRDARARAHAARPARRRGLRALLRRAVLVLRAAADRALSRQRPARRRARTCPRARTRSTSSSPTTCAARG